MAFKLPKLPYAYDALAPRMSEDTLRTHHGKHHKTYVDTLNELIEGTPFEKMDLEAIVKKTADSKEHKKIFNNAAQAWNHTVFWRSMSPTGARRPREELAPLVEKSFGGLDKFKDKFAKDAAAQFGSGWAWLIEDGGKLEIVTTSNAATPMTEGKRVLLTCDVWEHAYYLDHKNKRPDFLKAFLGQLIDWDFALARLRRLETSEIRMERA
jgi:superoxide dismutase, Fe-Mn family